jgi:hypothetical protein
MADPTPEERMRTIMSDPNKVTTTLTQEAVSPTKYRPLTQKITSLLEPLYFVAVEIVYVWPATDKRWGAERSHTFTLQEVA